MSLVPSTYRCCQPHADLAVSGKAAAPGPVRPQEARRPGRRAALRAITKYGFYRNKRELTTAAFKRARAAGHQTNTTPRS
jgi:hypothetical protein